jgi:RES domain-containing protein
MNPARDLSGLGESDTGWYRIRIGIVEIAFVYDGMTEQSFEHFLEAACRSIDECADDEQVALFLEVRDPALMNSEWRKRLAMALKERAHKLAQIRPAYVMVTSSVVVRSALKVLQWVAPPPYPHTVVATLEEGFEFIARYVPGLDARELQATYERLRADLLTRLG